MSAIIGAQGSATTKLRLAPSIGETELLGALGLSAKINGRPGEVPISGLFSLAPLLLLIVIVYATTTSFLTSTLSM